MFWFFLSCSPPEVSVFGQMNTLQSVQVGWDGFSFRPKSITWKEEWTEIEPNSSSHILGTEPVELASTILEQEEYVHFFTDALTITHNGQEIEDIIEPIACPIPSFGKHKIFITYIIIESEIFAMDCVIN